MRALSVIDHLFLLLETRKQPMHVAGLCIFELPKNASEDFLYQFVEQIKTSQSLPIFPFNQVLHKVAFWKEDDAFEVQHHFRHIALPRPCGMKELLTYISREHGRMMDRTKPLWEFHVIDGLAPEQKGGSPRFAIWLKVHHSMVDGIAAMRLLQMSLSQSQTEQMSIPFWSFTPKYRNQIDAILPIHKPALQIVKEQLATIYPVGREVAQNLKNRFNKQADVISTFDAPKCILNQKIGSSRYLSARSFSKNRFATIAKAFDATTNDVILAVCAGALRQYLLGEHALPDKPLIAFVPISLRRDKSALGNQISFLLTNLGTHHNNPISRLQTIKDSIDAGKVRFSRMNQAEVINYSALTYAWAGINLATGLLPKRQAFNLIISNVPGDDTPLFLNGAKLTGIYPASVLFDGQALNITLANYQDKIDFGITACNTTLPHIENLLDFIELELVAFEALCHDKADKSQNAVSP